MFHSTNYADILDGFKTKFMQRQCDSYCSCDKFIPQVKAKC